MQTQPKRTVLAVDDDEMNLMILIKTIQDAGYTALSFSSGEAAWAHLQQHPQDADIALLDKMMPGVSGLELLRRIKSSEEFKRIPVILQTGDVGVAQMREGLETGAYYYLTKPFHPEILTAILHSAAAECTMRETLLDQMTAGHVKFIGLFREGEFAIKTHSEAQVLAASLSQAANYPEFVAIGLTELLSNAIEHGNLDIGYQRKRKCLMSNSWTQELAERAADSQYRHRIVRVHAEKTPQGLHLTIKDEGKGFDWRHHLYDEDAPGRLNEPNGRGVAKAMVMLDEMRYVGNGSEVHCTIGLPNPQALTFETGVSPDPLHS